jgi:hypothetical protein
MRIMPRKANPMTAVLKNLSVAEVRALFEKKLKQEQKRLPALKAKLAALMKRVDRVNRELEAIEGKADVKPVVKRRRRKKKAAVKKIVVRKKAAKKKVVKAARKKAVKKAAKKAVQKAAPKKRAKKAVKAKVVKKKAATKKTTVQKAKPVKPAGAKKVTVRQAIATAIKNAGKPIGPAEISKAIIEQKLLANASKSLAKQVANALLKHDEFTRVVKGKYGLK